MTYYNYIKRWDDDAYVAWLWRKKREWKLNGCSWVPDHYLLGCLEHDVAYRLHMDPYQEYLQPGSAPPEKRKAVDRNMRWYMVWQNSGDELLWRWLGKPRRWLWWVMLRWRGSKAWEDGLSRIPKKGDT